MYCWRCFLYSRQIRPARTQILRSRLCSTGHGWPAALAQQYLERYLTFGLTDKHVEGMIRFFDRATAGGLVPDAQELQAAS